MDEQNVEACLMLPTAGVGVETQLRETPDVLYPSLRAFNRWVEEDWGYGGDRRVHGAALLSLFDLPSAIEELERLIGLGARFVVLTAGPFAGRSPADPRLFSKDMWRFGPPPLKPSETFRQNVWVAPFFEDDIVALARLLGVEHVLCGSDYPHPEGLAWPAEFTEELEGMSAPEVRAIMRDNFAALV